MALLLQSGRRVDLQRLHIDLGVAVYVVDRERAPRVARIVLAALVQRVVVEQRHLPPHRVQASKYQCGWDTHRVRARAHAQMIHLPPRLMMGGSALHSHHRASAQAAPRPRARNALPLAQASGTRYDERG
jgi:hypothetical protein